MPLKDPEKRSAYHKKYMRTIWYPKNKVQHIARVKNLKKIVSGHLEDIKRTGRCMDCGVSGKKYPCILDFDHRSDKSFNVANFRMHILSKKGLETEIKKCDLVCSNCHRIRTFLRNKMKS